MPSLLLWPEAEDAMEQSQDAKRDCAAGGAEKSGLLTVRAEALSLAKSAALFRALEDGKA